MKVMVSGVMRATWLLLGNNWFLDMGRFGSRRTDLLRHATNDRTQFLTSVSSCWLIDFRIIQLMMFQNENTARASEASIPSNLLRFL